jgi:hypothetical protein
LATLTPTEPPDPPTDSLPWGAGFALAGTPFLASAIALGLVVLWQMIVGQSLVETASDCTRVAMMTFAFGIAPALMLQVPIDAFGRKHALANDARLALQAASVSVPYFGLPFALDGLLSRRIFSLWLFSSSAARSPRSPTGPSLPCFTRPAKSRNSARLPCERLIEETCCGWTDSTDPRHGLRWRRFRASRCGLSGPWKGLRGGEAGPGRTWVTEVYRSRRSWR